MTGPKPRRVANVAAQWRKAIGGGLASGLAATFAALPDGLARTIVGVAIATLAGAGITGALPNRDARRRAR